MENIIGRILALVMTALATVGVYQLYGNARDAQNFNEFSTQMSQIQQAVTTTYQRATSRYAFGANPVADDTAAKMGLLPSTAFSYDANNHAIPSNPYGGTYSIVSTSAAAAGVAYSTTNGFGVFASSLSPAACIQLLQGLSTNSTAYGYSVGAEAAAAAPGTIFATMGAGAIEGSCTPATGATTVNLTVYYNG